MGLSRSFHRVGIFLLLAALLAPARASSETFLERAGSAVGGFVRQVVEFLLPGSSESERELEAALETYANGLYYTTLRRAVRLRALGEADFRDEADLLEGLAAAEIGLRGPAVSALRSVLESPSASPYYPVALDALLELDDRLDHPEAAAANARKYLTSFWRRPRSAHEASIIGAFLRQGNLESTEASLRTETPTREFRRLRREDRPADRAVYSAGRALLRVHDWDAAAIAFASLAPESRYFAFARHAMGQAAYGRGDLDEAEGRFVDVYTAIDSGGNERFLLDRTALDLARLFQERDQNDEALDWLRAIDADGPFALHGTLFAAEIEARRDAYSVALARLEERSELAGEPKLRARAAGLEAQLRRALGDMETAVRRFEEGIQELEAYASELDRESRDASALRVLFEGRERARNELERWRRENVVLAIPGLLFEDMEPGWLAKALASALASSEGSYPIFVPEIRHAPFTNIPFQLRDPSPPPRGAAYPPVFRRSQRGALWSAFRHGLGLERALAAGDDRHLVLTTLDTDLRLERSSGGSRIGEGLALPESILSVARAGGSPTDVLVMALLKLPDGTPNDAAIIPVALRRLEQWRLFEETLVSRALTDEAREIRDLKLALQFDLSETLSRESIPKSAEP